VNVIFDLISHDNILQKMSYSAGQLAKPHAAKDIAKLAVSIGKTNEEN